MENKDQNQEPIRNQREQPDDHLSGEEILKKIDSDANESDQQHGEEEHSEGNDLMHKLGLSKKDRLKKENAELKLKAEELNDRYLRLHAEFDNYKKRNIRERNEFAKTAGIEIIQALLPVADDFGRAVKQMESSQNVDELREGIKLIQQKLTGILEAKGLKQMKSIGEVFNPELHDAITEIPVEDKSMKGKVVDEIESGYYLNDKIIRHSKVVVGK